MEQEGKCRQTAGVLLTIFLGTVMFIWLACTVRPEAVCFDSEPVYELDGTWQAEVNGRVKEVRLPAKVEAKAGDEVRFSRILQEQETICNSLLFHSGHQYVRIYVGGELILEYGTGQEKPIRMSPGAPWHYTRLPDDWAGKELMIQTVAAYDSEAGIQDKVYLGTKAGLLYQVVKDAAPSLLFTLPVLVAGGVILCAGFFFKLKETARKMYRLGIFTLVTGLWILMESRVTQLFTGRVLLCMNLIFLLFGLVPVLFLYYLLSYSVFNSSSYIHSVFWLAVFNYAAVLVFNVTGCADFMQTVPLVHFVMLLGAAGILEVYIRSKVKKKQMDAETRNLFLAIWIFAVFGLLDMLRFYLAPGNEAIIFIRFGLFCFVAVLGISACRQESQGQMLRMEQKVLQKLAYTDMLTSLKNRTAFEEKAAWYRKNKEQEQRLLVMMTDMNGLKNINDTYGHAAGDEAIIVIADLIRKHFGAAGMCYRIGGDEFCVLAEEESETAFAGRMEAYIQDADKQEIRCGSRLSVAAGYARCREQGIDRALIEADRKMYERKSRMKREELQ